MSGPAEAEGDLSGGRSEEEVLAAIEKRRRRPVRRVAEEQITLSHGAGGRSTHDLIEGLFMPQLGNPMLEVLADGAVFRPGDEGERLAITTDSYVVRPLVFPGGDIGELAVNGTINDLAVTGARPLLLSAGFILEEGFSVAELGRIAASMASAAERAGVAIATADTKVVERGKADGLYLNTTGVGVVRPGLELSAGAVRPGDRVLVSGTIGDHGMAVMVARGDLELEVDLRSDTAPLSGPVGALLDRVEGVRWMRDPTRGGLATALAELALASETGIALEESALPIRAEVNAACEILGIDPLYVANEGKFVAVVAPESAEEALAAVRSDPLGSEAALIGEIRAEPPGMVVLKTSLGGSRIVDMLAGDPLPRIC